MKFTKVCMDCTNEFETEKLFDNTLICPRCLSGNIYQEKNIDYNEITIEDCFVLYHTNKIASICNGDKHQVEFVEV